ncbi:sirohydrochlorin chelatase [Streptomyces scabiei]|uniref:sirohydrochlorin chelatase n=1 Tax=Streptomyces scabiei TaxID=1930 RepID=UPI0029AB7D3F|nr:sirohydrochlorin chelatase [Streptomyces scabiei]MDX3603235.1 sirohydrochlorin chelatase [Streptomyces scabiei]
MTATTTKSNADLDSTAHIMNLITDQLAAQLSRVSRDGTRRPAPPALVLVAHGSRDPRALATVRTLMDRVREQRPGLSVRLGHIELNEPLLPDTLAALGDREAVLVPLLLSRGYHVKRDIPETAAASGARTRLAAAGSRDPEAAEDTGRTARLLADRLGVPVVPAYASAAAPTVAEAVRALTAAGRTRVAVASYFTAPGRFATECAKAAPWIASAPLGAHPSMATLILHRYDEARTTRTSPLPALATT